MHIREDIQWLEIVKNSVVVCGSFSLSLIVEKVPPYLGDFAGFCYLMEGFRRNRVGKGLSLK